MNTNYRQPPPPHHHHHHHHHNNNTLPGDLGQPEATDPGMDLEFSSEAADDTDQWDRLPQEILTKIFSNLSCSEIELAESTCDSWKRACNDPCLWRKMEFYFDGLDSLRLVTKAFRVITSKGHFMRELIVRIGNPGLNQAWLMSECIQQLFDFISQQALTCHIERFTMDNLIVFTQNRFFRLSKESTLNSLNNFLRSQKNLKSVNFVACKFNPSEGLKLIRTLKHGQLRNTIQKMDLHNYFKRRYITATTAFKIISSFPALVEIGVDANYVDDTILCWLTRKSPHKKPLRSLKVYFEALKPPPGNVSRESWTAARQSGPHSLQVSFYFCGWLAQHWVNPYITDCIPLVECHICWKRVYRGPRTFYADLTFLVDELSTQNSSLLERFTLSSGIRSFPALDDALIRLATSCKRLTEFSVDMRLSNEVIRAITDILSQRPHHVKCRFQPPERPHGMMTFGHRLRNRGQ